MYGDTLSSESLFDDRMSALSREIGPRGRADAVVVADAPEPTPEAEDAGDASALQSELAGMRLTAVQKRAMSAGLDAEAVADAMDSDDPKASLIGLIMEVASSRGPTERIAFALQAGGDTAADALTAVLDHAIEAIDRHALSSPRRPRKPLMELMDRADSAAESIDAAWCDRVSADANGVEELSGHMAIVEGLDVASSDVSDAVSSVTSLLDCVNRCGSVVLRSTHVLSCNSADTDGRLAALESLCNLSEGRQAEINDGEVSAFGCVKELLRSLDLSSQCDECVPSCMALYTLGCRIGLSVCATEEMVDLTRWVALCSMDAMLSGGGPQDAACAAHALSNMLWWEAPTKSSPDVRAPLDLLVQQVSKSQFRLVGELDTQRIADAACSIVKGGTLAENNLSLSCGGSVLHYLLYTHPGANSSVDDAGAFDAALELHDKVAPSGLPAEWWIETCALVDVTSVRLVGVWFVLCNVRRVPSMIRRPWWRPVLERAITNTKTNETAGLS
eukprot:COSAG04_NODE_2892_length_3413_cov_210.165661_2_plen_503_part_01